LNRRYKRNGGCSGNSRPIIILAGQLFMIFVSAGTAAVAAFFSEAVFDSAWRWMTAPHKKLT
jgi:hypothetical protein